MPFDFNALMQNPLFQQGLATLGGAVNSPGLMNAYNAMQARRKLELEQQQRQMEQERHQAELEQSRVRNQLYGAQVKAQERNLELQARKDEAILDFVKRRQQAAKQLANPSMVEQGGDSGSSAVPIQPQQPALVPPPEPVGKYGTPLKHLDRLMQIESSGNPNAVGPLLPEGDRALGPFQFRQGTINMLKKKGIVFNPFNIEQSRDAADFYIQDLVKEHGSYEKAYAAYGGFKTKDPTRYVSAIMGSPEKQAQQSAQSNQLAAQSARYKQLQEEAGAMQLLSGDMGGLKTLVEAEKPDYELGREQRAINEERRKEADERRKEADDKRKALAPPKGYIRTPDGKIVPELTVEEGKATAYVTQMSDAQKTFEALKKKGYDPTSYLTQAGTAMAGGMDTPIPGVTLPTNILASSIQQQAKQAQNMWAEAYLRFKTGATTNPGEIATNVKTFFPQFGDKADNIAQKERARKIVEKAVEVSAGRGVDALPPELRREFEAVTSGGGAETRTVVRTGRRKDGTRVIQYSDGSIENVK